ncbi:MAG: MFS transporter [Ardenticatenaceae bacterium]|nr:MFS transporter [Ardenticatenaceae bacterium]
MNRSRKLAYSLGNLAASLTYNAFFTYVNFFYVDTLKLPACLFALGFTLYTLWNAINDPLAGALSDRTRTRWGRRVPYIALGSLPLAVFFALVWLAPFRGNDPRLFAYFLLIIFLYDGFYTFVTLNLVALFPEMYPSLDERAEVSGYRQVFGLVGLVLGIALPPILYGSFGWEAMGLIFGVVSAGCLYVSLWGSRERPAFQQDEPLRLKAALLGTLANRSFDSFVASYMLVQYAFSLIMAAIPFYAKYVLRLPEQNTSFLLLATILVAFPMLYVWGRAAIRWGTRAAMLGSMGVLAAALLPFLVVRDFRTALLATSAVGLGLGGLILLTDVLLADIVDEDELKTGVRREGMYFGMSGFLGRLSGVLQTQTINGILLYTGYNARLAVDAQPPAVLDGLRALVSLIPMVALGLGTVALLFYPLHGSRLARVKAEMAAVHARKGARPV